MNRLIIIGNGFDLAHGIKTSYHDFLLDYLKTVCLEAINGGITQYNSPNYGQLYYYEDVLIKIEIPVYSDLENIIKQLRELHAISGFLEFSKRMKIKYDFELLQTSIERLSAYNWVDFETEYFDLLTKQKYRGSYRLEETQTINSQFEFLKK